MYRQTRLKSLILALSLMIGLILPAFGVRTHDEAETVVLNRTEATLLVGGTVTLKPVTLPNGVERQDLSWRSSDPDVAAVSDTGKITGGAPGTTEITVSVPDTDTAAVCQVTVTDRNYVTGVVVTSDREIGLPVGEAGQLSAEITYAQPLDGAFGNEAVTWQSSDPDVASVDPEGVLQFHRTGAVTITAAAVAAGADGRQVYGSLTLIGLPAEIPEEGAARLIVPRTLKVWAGQGLKRTLTVPAEVQRNQVDVTEGYTLSYQWRDADEILLGNEAAQTICPQDLGHQRLFCQVTARPRNGGPVLSAQCELHAEVLPGLSQQGILVLEDGAVSLKDVYDGIREHSVIDQLAGQMEQEEQYHVVFDLASCTGGAAGTLDVQKHVCYAVDPDQEAEGLPLEEVVFTPQAGGRYTIGYFVYGEEEYYGQLEITVLPERITPPQRTCSSTGFQFTGSEFYQRGSSDPVVTVIFDQPRDGLLLRDFKHGCGIPDTGAEYYTDSASQGQYHISQLTYLPKADVVGDTVLSMQVVTQSGRVFRGFMKVQVERQDHSKQFIDVVPETVGTWAAPAIDFVHTNGIVNGVSGDRFAPNGVMDRAMFITMLYRAAGSPEMTVTTHFEDLDVNSYYFPAVLWSGQEGIITGTSATTFSPDAPITREQIAPVLYRYTYKDQPLPESGTTLDQFQDKNQVSSYAERATAWAVRNGILRGIRADTLAPQSPGTRAQTAVLLHRFFTLS